MDVKVMSDSNKDWPRLEGKTNATISFSGVQSQKQESCPAYVVKEPEVHKRGLELKVCEETMAWLQSFFVGKVMRVEDLDTMQYKLQCTGVPALVWCEKTFKHLAAEVGSVILVDEGIENRSRMDKGRVLISTPLACSIDAVITITVEGEDFDVRLLEEYTGCCSFHNNDFMESDPFSWLNSEDRWVKEHDDDVESKTTVFFAGDVAASDEEDSAFLNSNCEKVAVTIHEKEAVVVEGESAASREVVTVGSIDEEWGVMSVLERNKAGGLGLRAVPEIKGKELTVIHDQDKGCDIPLLAAACLDRDQMSMDVVPLKCVDEKAWLGVGASFSAEVDSVGIATSCGLALVDTVKSTPKFKKKKKIRGPGVKKSRKKSFLPSFYRKKKMRMFKGEYGGGLDPSFEEFLDCEGTMLPAEIKNCNKERELEIVLQRGNLVEDARRLWEMGKELGVLSVDEDEPIIHKLMLLEMNALGIVDDGEDVVSGGRAKGKEIFELARSVAADFVCFMETKLVSVDRASCRRLWYDGDDFDFIAFPTDDNSGGLLSMWRRSCFSLVRHEVGVGFILVEGVWGDGAELCVL
ncbi:hypothetical protein RIF29_13844 [Crotalaria pallida]|uniref:DUF4283 domain-containing protein n=1 Tax=Crotalaria pallida TaxID=3830 RepID=A0AAN9FAP0_CROPI